MFIRFHHFDALLVEKGFDHAVKGEEKIEHLDSNVQCKCEVAEIKPQCPTIPCETNGQSVCL
ncbi:hypothetical protein SERLA73DRAFT_134462 [Serpula lacrymans var. lacrymans S7.3]|uniref:Uncharacterized protein n=2 Tax=Serpula lacrymans var. lacrymans TaxID=341189 RepID=F8PRV3_SERL3|nr:uncharacterized protein SERLADRAFT_386037 [Serpula lacrymans var. lacrymans S7.9]EGO01188.1 hypothetical protein SERLA73DRAFT_134462 [Serpula lacrymans var. lacrymans S7.3]EGO26836.1 hypothetical protein SERLADRAFT_386037 [Serpula lacrymans var. lacrymans S7.9]